MSSWNDLTHLWSTLTEIDTSALREQVRTPFRVAILSSDAEASQWLLDQLRTDPFDGHLHPLPHTLWPYTLPTSDSALREAGNADLALLVLSGRQEDVQLEQEVTATLRRYNRMLTPIIVHLQNNEGYLPAEHRNWRGAAEVIVNRRHPQPLAADLIPTLIELFPEQRVALAYHIPALRAEIASIIINETCLTNAGYAASTGLAEIIPVLNIPFNVADIVVLTKNQALMAYKLALSLGQDIGAQQMAAQLAGVLGSGFIWRELARRLVGFIPLWGLVPKVAVAYAGTYVTGYAVFQWYAYGRKLSPERMHQLYAEALAEGKRRAAALVPRRRLRLRLPFLWRRHTSIHINSKHSKYS